MDGFERRHGRRNPDAASGRDRRRSEFRTGSPGRPPTAVALRSAQTIGYLERGEYNPSLHLAFQIAECSALPLEAIEQLYPAAG
jgi:hypothetical protein